MDKNKSEDRYRKILDEKIDNWIWKWRVFAFLPGLIIMVGLHCLRLDRFVEGAFFIFLALSLIFPYVLFFSMGEERRNNLREKFNKSINGIYKEEGAR